MAGRRKRKNTSSTTGRFPKKAKRDTDRDAPVPDRKEINVADLDLMSEQYMDEWAPPLREIVMKPEKRRWIHPGPEPLTDKSQLPRQWTTEDPDWKPPHADCRQTSIEFVFTKEFPI